VHLHDAFDHGIDIATDQQPDRQHHRHGTEQWIVDLQQHGQGLTRSLDHVGVHQVPHQQGITEHEPGKKRMELGIALQDRHALVIAQLEAGNDVDDQIPQEQRDRQHPHHRVAVIGSGYR
jgi:hypothetical protein